MIHLTENYKDFAPTHDSQRVDSIGLERLGQAGWPYDLPNRVAIDAEAVGPKDRIALDSREEVCKSNGKPGLGCRGRGLIYLSSPHFIGACPSGRVYRSAILTPCRAGRGYCSMRSQSEATAFDAAKAGPPVERLGKANRE